MHPRQTFGRQVVPSSQLRDPMAIAGGLQPVVAVPPIGMHEAAGLDRFVDKGVQTVGRRVGDATQPDPADAVAYFFGGDDDQRLRRRGPPLSPADAAHKTFVDLHPARQPIASRPDHRSAQLVQPGPRRFVTPQPQEALQPQGAGTRLLAGHPPHRVKPQPEWFPRILEHRSRRDRCLGTARGTLPESSRRPPGLRLATPAAKAIGPPQPAQIDSARVLGRKPGLELAHSPRLIGHAPETLLIGGTSVKGIAQTPGILGRRALPAGRLARLGATPDVHHGLVTKLRLKPTSKESGRDANLRY